MENVVDTVQKLIQATILIAMDNTNLPPVVYADTSRNTFLGRFGGRETDYLQPYREKKKM